MINDEMNRRQFNTINRPEMQEFPNPLYTPQHMMVPQKVIPNTLTINPPLELPEDSGKKPGFYDPKNKQQFGVGIGSEFQQSQVINKFEVNPNNLVSYEAKQKY